jgi:hypothetical protein
MAKKIKEKTQRVIRVSKENNRIFKQMLLDLYDIGVFRTPDELADELFQIGLYSKAHTIRESEEKRDHYKSIPKN